MARTDRGDATAAPTFPPNGKTLARFDRPTGNGTTLLIVSDTHLSPTAHGSLKCFHRTKQRLEMAIADAHRLDVDGFVVAGDLTKDGTPEEYALAGELLRVAPRPTLVVPGNHDVTVSDGPIGSGSDFAAWLDREAYPVTEQVGPVSVTGIDTTRPPATAAVGGAVSADASATLCAKSPATPRIAVMHHPLATVPGRFESALPTGAYQVQQPDTVADSLVAGGFDLVVSGHVHWPYAGQYHGLNVVGAPSSSSFPPAYLLVHVGRQGTTVTLVPLAGEAGLSEAYEFAVGDEYRGEAIQKAVCEGYFGEFPLVNQRERSARPRAHPSTVTDLTESD